LGAEAICCLLHSLAHGGTGWQWVRLLSRHVEDGGRATILAPPGPLAEPARAAGIEVVAVEPWVEFKAPRVALLAAVAKHDVAIVQWEQGVMEAFGPALRACGRAALSLHQSPRALPRWFGPPTVAMARAVLELALADPRAVALVRGEAHRRQVAAAFGLPTDRLRVLPASVPLAALPFRPRTGTPREVLAMTRLSPEKAAVVRLAVELVAARVGAGHRCELRIAGEGAWRDEAVALCGRRLSAGTWRIEGAPADPIARLGAADVVVAQGLTTLEAAALGRRVAVARAAGEDGAAGAVLTAEAYPEAARDPFGEPALDDDPASLWRSLLAVGEDELRALRRLVEEGNSIAACARALREALA
jgi:hypothetical protein